MKSRISPCLWFDGEAEEAAKFYVSVFPNSKIGRISRYGVIPMLLNLFITG